MTTKTNIDRLADDLAANGPSKAADIAARLGMTSNQVQRTISNHNRAYAPGKSIVQTVIGTKHAPGIYALQFSTTAKQLADKPIGMPVEKIMQFSPAVATELTMERATEQLAQCIVSQMRAEIDRLLQPVVRQAVNDGIGSMVQGIRGALASAFGKPAEPAPVVKAVVADEIKLPEPVKPDVLHGEAMAAKPVSLDAYHAMASAPVTNILSTRTRHREKAQPEVVAPSVQAPAPTAKRKLILCSLNAVQRELIIKEFSDCFDLRIYHKDQVKALRKAINHGDTVLLMGDFLGHSVFEMVDHAGANRITVMGGLTSLREELTRLYVGEKVAA